MDVGGRRDRSVLVQWLLVGKLRQPDWMLDQRLEDSCYCRQWAALCQEVCEWVDGCIEVMSQEIDGG